VGCHPRQPSDPYRVRGRAVGVAWHADGAMGRAPSVTACVVPLPPNAHKHTDTRHPLPEFFLQNTCKFAVQAAAWIPALAVGSTPHNASILTHFAPPVLESVVCEVCGAEHGLRNVKIPVERSQVV